MELVFQMSWGTILPTRECRGFYSEKNSAISPNQNTLNLVLTLLFFYFVAQCLGEALNNPSRDQRRESTLHLGNMALAVIIRTKHQ